MGTAQTDATYQHNLLSNSQGSGKVGGVAGVFCHNYATIRPVLGLRGCFLMLWRAAPDHNHGAPSVAAAWPACMRATATEHAPAPAVAARLAGDPAELPGQRAAELLHAHPGG